MGNLSTSPVKMEISTGFICCVSRVLFAYFISAAAIGASCSIFFKFLITLFYGKVDLWPHGLFIHVYAVF